MGYFSVVIYREPYRAVFDPEKVALRPENAYLWNEYDGLQNDTLVRPHKTPGHKKILEIFQRPEIFLGDMKWIFFHKYILKKEDSI